MKKLELEIHNLFWPQKSITCKFFTFKCVNVYYRKKRKENHFIMAFNVTIVFQYFCPNKKLKHWHFEAWLLPKRGNAVCP